MLRNSSYAFLALFLILTVAACGQKEEPVSETETAVEETPKVVPGEMVLIPAGEFILGTSDAKLDEKRLAYPEQKVDLPAYWIDKYEVTNTQFLDFSISTGYLSEGAAEGKDWRTFFTPEKAKFPVVYVTWNDAKAFCEAQGKRLPTEIEWEKAARGVEGFRYPWGNNWESGRSNNYEAGFRAPVAVGQYEGDVSPFGVHDMLGNVQEWTDNWLKAYKGNTRGNENFGERYRVVRGASSRIYGSRYHIWARSAYLPKSLYDFGFRCAKDATPEEAAQAK